MDRKGTNELISGEKSFIAILSNLRVYFVVRLPDYMANSVRVDPALRTLFVCVFVCFAVCPRHRTSSYVIT